MERHKAHKSDGRVVCRFCRKGGLSWYWLGSRRLGGWVLAEDVETGVLHDCEGYAPYLKVMAVWDGDGNEIAEVI